MLDETCRGVRFIRTSKRLHRLGFEDELLGHLPRLRRFAHALARSAADAPEIDGIVRIADGDVLTAGSFARVRIVGADAHDLDARLAD